VKTILEREVKCYFVFMFEFQQQMKNDSEAICCSGPRPKPVLWPFDLDSRWTWDAFQMVDFVPPWAWTAFSASSLEAKSVDVSLGFAFRF
jgi:hypothetical protein